MSLLLPAVRITPLRYRHASMPPTQPTKNNNSFALLISKPKYFNPSTMLEPRPYYVKKVLPIYNEEDVKKCTTAAKSLRKVKVKKPSIYNTIMRQRHQKRSIYYFTFGRKVDMTVYTDLQEKKPNPFYIPKDIEDFSYRTKYRDDHKAFREKERTYNHMNRPYYRTRKAEGLLERLHIPSAAFKLPGKAMVPDIDPEFFTAVAGRPIIYKFNIRQYLKEIQDCFRVRMMTAWKRDDVLTLEEQYSIEKAQLTDIKERVEMYRNCFESFLEEDHQTSAALLRQAEYEVLLSKSKRDEIKSIAKEQNFFRSKVLILDEQWKISRSYQRFLYRMAPHWWRVEHDYLHKKAGTDELATGSLEIPASELVINVTSVTGLISQFTHDVQVAEPPLIYFEDPSQMHWILYELERNNMLALLQCEELTPPALFMVSGYEKAVKHFKRECRVLTNIIAELRQEVLFEEQRALDLEKKARLLCFGLFKELIVEKSVLNIAVAVEDCYEKSVAPNDSNLSLATMMKEVEEKQESLMIALDVLPTEIVVKATAACYRDDIRVMKEAEEAGKLVKQIENLLKSLMRSMEPKSDGKVPRALMWRSFPPKEKMDLGEPPKPLTLDEIDYLHFFTEFCFQSDDHQMGRKLCQPLPKEA